MKPRILTLQAFGPFAGRQDIDFTALPADALFLIHGPTGAGKTAILDGLCYALYGVTSGDERSAREMRSHHAAEGCETLVEFEFTLGRRRFRVNRAPEQERPAQRAGRDGQRGTVTVPARAELAEWRAAAWHPLAAKTTEVSDRIVALLGFEANQFRQVILLPQGRFRDFLAADSRDRERILEALFATERYKGLQERLQGSARQLETLAREGHARRAALLAQAELADADALNRRLQESRAVLVQLAADGARLQAQEQACQQALAAGEALAARFREQAAARADLERRLAADCALMPQRQRRQRARQARDLAPLHRLAQEARTQAAELAARLATTGAAAARAQQAALTAATDLGKEEQRQPERQAAAQEVARLEGLQDAVSRLAASASALTQAQAAAATVATEHATLHTRVQDLTNRRNGLATEIAALLPVAGRNEALGLQLQQVEAQQQALAAAATAAAELKRRSAAAAQSATAFAQAEAAWRQADQNHRDLEQAWRHGQAGALARQLVAGQPCPVCGSTNHPEPATDAAAVPGDAELDQAQAGVKAAEARREQARQAWQALQQAQAAQAATVQACSETLAHCGNPQGDPVAGQYRGLQAALADATRATIRLAAARDELAALEGQLAAQGPALERARQAAEEAKVRVAAAGILEQERSAAVPTELRAPAALAHALAAQARRLEQLDGQLQGARRRAQEAATAHAVAMATAEAAMAQATAAETARDKATAALVDALGPAGFADEADLVAATLDGASLGALEQALQDHDLALAAARERLLRADAGVGSAAAPDVAALQEELRRVRAGVDHHRDARTQRQRLLESDTRTAQMLAELGQELARIEQRFGVLGHLAEIANGHNSRRLTFQRYVLAALLDDVLRQASLRLRAMSRGRYTLRRREDVGDGRRAGGLDLEVCDDFTGRPRPAGTLSGGEGFMAALALALGLSDVVQGYAGGIQLDTLFIDEGFGSLDPESLDMALQTLIDLRQQGRLVGIISHVEELKRQIDLGIEVTLSATGSRVRVGPTLAPTAGGGTAA